MRKFFEWIGKGLPWIFSLLGIAATVYFSAFYIPDYLEQMKRERTRVVNRDLIETVQELVYNGKAIDTTVLRNLINGKELTYEVVYPYSLKELLLQVRDGFVTSNYLPLEQRDSLTIMLDSAVATLEIPTSVQADSTHGASSGEVAGASIQTYISVSLGMMGAILGLIAIFVKLQRERVDEIERFVVERKEEVEHQVGAGLRYEQLVGTVLTELGTDFTVQPSFAGGLRADFEVYGNRGTFLVECKYRRSMVIKFAEMEQLGRIASTLEASLILVTAGFLSASASKWLEGFNSQFYEKRIHVIQGADKDTLLQKLSTLIVDPESPTPTDSSPTR